eukprot:365079-Chlamydomonas_euryale.AAC.2
MTDIYTRGITVQLARVLPMRPLPSTLRAGWLRVAAALCGCSTTVNALHAWNAGATSDVGTGIHDIDEDPSQHTTCIHIKQPHQLQAAAASAAVLVMRKYRDAP